MAAAEVRLEVVDQAELTGELRAERLRLHRQAWPESADADHDPALRPVCLLLLAGDRLLASLDILAKSISHAGVRYAAAGLSAVVTDRAARGAGHGSRLVAEGRRRIAAEHDLGIFSCDQELVGFYAAAGWRPLPGTVLLGGTPADPLPSDRLGKVVLAGFFSELARAHAAEFENARIELYPGELDRLW